MHKGNTGVGGRYKPDSSLAVDTEPPVDWGIPAWAPNYYNILGEAELDIGCILTREIDADSWHLLTIELGMRAATHLILDTYDLATEYDFHRVNGFYRFE